MNRISALAFAAAVLVTGGAYAADLQIPATPDKAMAMAVPSTWDGFYAGVNAGYGWASRSGDFEPAFAPPGSGPKFNYSLAGGLIGAQAGFNYELTDNFVVGVQVDADAANINGTPTGLGNGNYNWLSTATAKLGYATDKFLVYVDGGYALAGLNFNGTFGCNFNQTDSGFTAGLGGAYKVTDNVSLDLSYNHIWFNNAQSSCTLPFGGGFPLQVNDNNLGADVVKLGVNYKFGG